MSKVAVSFIKDTAVFYKGHGKYVVNYELF